MEHEMESGVIPGLTRIVRRISHVMYGIAYPKL